MAHVSADSSALALRQAARERGVAEQSYSVSPREAEGEIEGGGMKRDTAFRVTLFCSDLAF